MPDTHPMTYDTAETFMFPGNQRETAVMMALSAKVKHDRNTDGISMFLIHNFCKRMLYNF